MRAAFATAAEAGDVDRLTEIGMRLWGAAGSDAAAVAQMRSAARAWLTEDDFQLPDEPVFDRLGEIAAPTVLLAGDRDRPSNLDCCLETAARIPGCTLRRLPEADHLLPLRAPEAVAETVPAHCGG